MLIKLTKSVPVLLTLSILTWAGTANADLFNYRSDTWGDLTGVGFLRAQADYRTGPVNNNPSTTFNSHVQQVKQWGVLDLNWKPKAKGLKFFARSRYQWDLTTEVVGITDWDVFPGVGKNVDTLRSGGRDAIAELWEVRADYESGPWWFRLGRQNIVWGDLAPTRLLDSFNPLDLSFHVFNELGGREAFDNIRIPKWALRGSYTFPQNPDYQLEAFISPNALSFIPTHLPDGNSPLDVVGAPAFVTIDDLTEDGENGVSAGVRLVGNYKGTGYSLVWMVRPESDTGINTLRSGTGPVVGAAGAPSALVKREYPSYHTLGFSTNSYIPAAKAVIRTEFMYNFDRPFDRIDTTQFLRLRAGNTHVETDEIGYAIAIDRPTIVFRKSRAMTISASIEQRFRGVSDDDLLAGEAYGLRLTKIDETETIFRLLLGQAWAGPGGRYDEIFTDLTFFYNFGDKSFINPTGFKAGGSSYFIQPAIRWEPGSHWRWGLWYTEFGGDDERPGNFGSLRHNSGLNLSLTYQF